MGQGETHGQPRQCVAHNRDNDCRLGYAWSPKRITVSSVGIKGKLKRFLEESDCHVAISLHSPLHDQRSALDASRKGMSIESIVELFTQLRLLLISADCHLNTLS